MREEVRRTQHLRRFWQGGQGIVARMWHRCCIRIAAMETSGPSLYQKLGGPDGVARLIEQFYLRVLDDPDLAPFFTHVSIDGLKRMQQEFFAVALGETTAHSGRSLSAAHHGRGIHAKHVGLFIQKLMDTLQAEGVSEEITEEVISRIDVHVNEITGQSY